MTLLTFRVLPMVLKLTLSFPVIVYGIYKLKETGVHPNLSDHIISEFTGRSIVECGTDCGTKSCASFRLDAATLNCILYDVYMSYTSPTKEKFYIVPNSPNGAALICPTPRIYNSTFANVALGKNVEMSPHWPGTGGSNIVDGLRSNGPCGKSKKVSNPYMTVDLGQSYNIYSIYILNHKYYEFLYRDIRVQVGENLSSMQQVHYQRYRRSCDITIFLPTPSTARYAQIYKIVHGRLNVCEMEVYAFI